MWYTIGVVIITIIAMFLGILIGYVAGRMSSNNRIYKDAIARQKTQMAELQKFNETMEIELEQDRNEIERIGH